MPGTVLDLALWIQGGMSLNSIGRTEKWKVRDRKKKRSVVTVIACLFCPFVNGHPPTCDRFRLPRTIHSALHDPENMICSGIHQRRRCSFAAGSSWPN